MNLRINQSETEVLTNKYIFLDTNYLGLMYEDPDVLEDTIKYFPGYLTVDPFIKFEFLRDIYFPEHRIQLEKFITSNIFKEVEDHQEVFTALKNNALLLSRLYGYKNGNKKSSPEIVDMILAAQLMRLNKNAVLVTANKKDFPSYIFDVHMVFNYEKGDGSMLAVSVINFNADKFNKVRIEYEEMCTRYVTN